MKTQDIEEASYHSSYAPLIRVTRIVNGAIRDRRKPSLNLRVVDNVAFAPKSDMVDVGSAIENSVKEALKP